MSEDYSKLIEDVKLAYKACGRCPSRGCGESGITLNHATAWGVAEYYSRLVPAQMHAFAGRSARWRTGFRAGFDWCDGEAQWDEFLAGFAAGRAVADAVFAWRESLPETHSAHDDEIASAIKYLHRDMLELHDHVDRLSGKMSAAGIDLRRQDIIDAEVAKATGSPKAGGEA